MRRDKGRRGEVFVRGEFSRSWEKFPVVYLGLIQQYQFCVAFSGQIGQFALVGGHRGSLDLTQTLSGFCGFGEGNLGLIL